jgi:hypothetical protein
MYKLMHARVRGQHAHAHKNSDIFNLYIHFTELKNKTITLFCGRILLGAFAKLRKATISFVVSVRPDGTQLPLDGFS